MISNETRETIREMHHKQISIRQICKLLGLSRNTVRKALNSQARPKLKKSKNEDHLNLVSELLKKCGGNVVRVQECLQHEHDLFIPYTTLTWMVRTYGLKEPKKKRSGSYVLGPGEEMQHDTSPYKIVLGNKKVNVQCAGLVLAFSRKTFVQFYPRFTRFEAKVFLSRGFAFFQGVCPRCVVDNTSVIVSHGTGADAIIAPEMEAFARLYQVVFVPHKVKDPNRKARVERLFSYVSTNFLAGRTFKDWTDLNTKALAWCQEVANARKKRSLGMSPDQAYLMERSSLTPLPVHVPEVYHIEHRVVDSEGYVHLETNRYSVPEDLVGKKVEVYKFWDKVKVVLQHQTVAEHERVIDRKDARITDPTHHKRYRPAPKGPCKEQRLLTGENSTLDQYVHGLKQRSRGRAVQPLRRLLTLKRTYPEEAFEKAIGRALTYNMFDLGRLENMILSFIAGDFFDL